jgi:hypothetical protein
MWGTIRRSHYVPVEDGQTLTVTDTVSPGPFATRDAREVISDLMWSPATFEAACHLHPISDADATITFPSPLPQGHEVWDRAVLDWYTARDRLGQTVTGPAVLVLDILQGGNLISGFVAKSLAKSGIHGFVLHMPQNGRRKRLGEMHDWSAFLPSLRQGAADARRARDVIAALPLVTGPIGLQGTSLGGFVATVAGSIDGAFGPVLLALTGGDVYGVLTRGRMDAVRVRSHLRDAGYDDQRLREWLWRIEPLRVAHRLDAKRTWLFSARFDQVVSAPHAKKLATEIGLDWQHHRQFAGCHYTCVVSAPRLLSEMIRAVQRRVAVA